VEIKKQKKWFLLVGILLSLGIAQYRALVTTPGVIEYISSYALYPFLRLQKIVVDPIKVWVDTHRTIAELGKALQQERAEKEQLRAENIKLQGAAHYEQEISDIVSFKKRYDTNAPIAHVLVRHITDHEHYVLVNAGANKGIQQDMVAVYKNCLVGKVDEVYPWYSKVRLITDKGCKVAACCVRTKSTGIHQGCNTTEQTLLQHVSHLMNIQKNDLVISSGEGLVFPQGFGLGKIDHFEQKGLQYNISVIPIIDVRNINYCLLLAKGEVSQAMQGL